MDKTSDRFCDPSIHALSSAHGNSLSFNIAETESNSETNPLCFEKNIAQTIIHKV